MNVIPQSNTLDVFARWVSRLIHPFTLVVPTLILVAWLSGTPLKLAVIWALLPLPIIVLPLLVLIAIRVRRRHYSDWDVSIREQRRSLYLVGLGSLLLLLASFILFDAPRPMQACLLAAAFAFGVGAIVNQVWTKISVHSTAAAGSAAVMFYFSPWIGMGFMLAALAASWARVRLRRHTISQVLAGWLIAIVCVAIVFPLIVPNQFFLAS